MNIEKFKPDTIVYHKSNPAKEYLVKEHQISGDVVVKDLDNSEILYVREEYILSKAGRRDALLDILLNEDSIKE